MAQIFGHKIPAVKLGAEGDNGLGTDTGGIESRPS
jgi:hypothetical protein